MSTEVTTEGGRADTDRVFNTRDFLFHHRHIRNGRPWGTVKRCSMCQGSLAPFLPSAQDVRESLVVPDTGTDKEEADTSAQPDSKHWTEG